MPGKEETTKQGVEDMLNQYVPPKAEDVKKDDDDDKDDKGKKKDDDDTDTDDTDTDVDTDVDTDDEDDDDEDDENGDDDKDDDEEEDEKEDDDEEDDEDDEEEDEEDDKGKKKSKEHSALADIIANIRAGKVDSKGKDDDEEEDKELPKPKKKAPAKKGEVYELITQELLDDSEGVLTAKTLNEFGTNIINLAIQGSLRATPVVVGKQIKRQKMFDSLVEAFYTDNEDLLKYKSFVSHTANQLAAKNPDWDETKIFEALAKESRKGLGIKERSRKVEDKRKKKKPAVPGKTRTKRRRKSDKDIKRSPKQKEIDELI